MKKDNYDAIVVGSGPNGLAAAIRLAEKGLAVLLIEAKDTIGGGMRTKELTLPGFHHDVCSAIHPLGIASPYFKTLPLEKFGLEYIHPEVLAAHPFDDGTAACLYPSLDDTARGLGRDEKSYRSLIEPILKDWDKLVPEFLSPIKIPKNPVPLALFGLKAIRSAEGLANSYFKTEKARGLWAGVAGHSVQPFSNLTSAAIALVLTAAGHKQGWPVPKGGSQAIAKALGGYFEFLGGEIITDFEVRNLKHLPSHRALLFDLTPKQILTIAGEKFSSLYKWQLGRYRYGMGVFKMDWALDGPIPFTSLEARKAGTVHLGGTFEEIAASEKSTSKGVQSERPYVLLAQQSTDDPSRAPEGKHTAWAYCHVPNGSVRDLTRVVENQIERFAPGFKRLILKRHKMNTFEMQNYNANYIGGDILGGITDLGQLFTRPVLRLSPYKTSAKGIYICSASTPPGGGVHGMCGFNAAEKAIKDLF